MGASIAVLTAKAVEEKKKKAEEAAEAAEAAKAVPLVVIDLDADKAAPADLDAPKTEADKP